MEDEYNSVYNGPLTKIRQHPGDQGTMKPEKPVKIVET